MDYKAKVVLAENVWKKIKWFTHNIDTEIGALGKVKIRQEYKEKYFYVYDLLFPKQEVSGATVSFSGGMWGDLVKKHKLKGLQDVAFYWHRHPGNSAHSDTDAEDTFDTFMSKEAKRKFFIFYQTAEDSSNVLNEEMRLDIRNPIRATLLHNSIELLKESEEDKKLTEECEKIMEEVIVEKKETACVVKHWGNGGWKDIDTANYNKGYSGTDMQRYIPRKPSNQIDVDTLFEAETISKFLMGTEYKTLDDAVLNGRFGDIDFDKEIACNNQVDGFMVEVKDQMDIQFEHGQATILCGEEVKLMLLGLIDKKTPTNTLKLNKVVKNNKAVKLETDDWEIKIQPYAKGYTELKEQLIKFFIMYNQLILKNLRDKYVSKDKEEEEVVKELEGIYTIENNEEAVSYILAQLPGYFFTEWQANQTSGMVFDMDTGNVVGGIFASLDLKKFDVSGKELISLIHKLEKEGKGQ